MIIKEIEHTVIKNSWSGITNNYLSTTPVNKEIMFWKQVQIFVRIMDIFENIT